MFLKGYAAGLIPVGFSTTTAFIEERSGVLHYLAFIKAEAGNILKNEHS